MAKRRPYRTVLYEGTGKTIRNMERMASGTRGAQNTDVRRVAENIVRWVTPRDELSQIAALSNWVRRHYTFLKDPVRVELVRDPREALRIIKRHGRFVGDCDCASTLQYGLEESVGIPGELMRMGWRGRSPDKYTHVTAAGRDQYGRLVVIDPVAADKTGKALSTARHLTTKLEGMGDMNGDRLARLTARLRVRTFKVRNAVGYKNRKKAMGRAQQARADLNAYLQSGANAAGLREANDALDYFGAVMRQCRGDMSFPGRLRRIPLSGLGITPADLLVAMSAATTRVRARAHTLRSATTGSAFDRAKRELRSALDTDRALLSRMTAHHRGVPGVSEAASALTDAIRRADYTYRNQRRPGGPARRPAATAPPARRPTARRPTAAPSEPWDAPPEELGPPSAAGIGGITQHRLFWPAVLGTLAAGWYFTGDKK
jgi:hypothetical protein